MSQTRYYVNNTGDNDYFKYLSIKDDGLYGFYHYKDGRVNASGFYTTKIMSDYGESFGWREIFLDVRGIKSILTSWKRNGT